MTGPDAPQRILLFLVGAALLVYYCFGRLRDFSVARASFFAGELRLTPVPNFRWNGRAITAVAWVGTGLARRSPLRWAD